MITPELIKKAQEERKQALKRGAIIIMALGTAVSLFGFVRIFTVGNLADHVVFLFGGIVTAIGIHFETQNRYL
jgi:hypothetical protein